MKDKKMNKFVFSDEVLAVIAQSLQLAMLTGTDIVDHLRMIEVQPDYSGFMPTPDETSLPLVLTPESKEKISNNISDLEQHGKKLFSSKQQVANE